MSDVMSREGDAEQIEGLLVQTGTDAGDVLALMHGGPDAPLAVPAPFSQPIVLVERMRVAGTSRVPGVAQAVVDLAEGDRLAFVREKDNAFDRWSIRVQDARGRKLGYVSADQNQILARLMDAGKCLYGEVLLAEAVDGWEKVEMAVYLDD